VVRKLMLTLLMGVVASLLGLGVTSTALADHSPDHHNFVCTNQGGGPNHKVVCIANITTGDIIEVNIENVNVFNDSQLLVVQNFLNNNLTNFLNISNVQVRIDKIALDVVTVVVKDLKIVVCQVKVFELGLVNLNIAKC
jgi:hypothetical protein